MSAHSKSKAYNPREPESNLIAHRGGDRDEIGVIRSICVKVIMTGRDVYLVTLLTMPLQERSSAKRKELFRQIQLQDKPDHPARKLPLQLLLDMPVRWSSTYVMLERAEGLKEVRTRSMSSR